MEKNKYLLEGNTWQKNEWFERECALLLTPLFYYWCNAMAMIMRYSKKNHTSTQSDLQYAQVVVVSEGGSLNKV